MQALPRPVPLPQVAPFASPAGRTHGDEALALVLLVLVHAVTVRAWNE